METFETKINLAEKSLNNIRGYLWERIYIFKVRKIKFSYIKRWFLERPKKSKKIIERKKVIWWYNLII